MANTWQRSALLLSAAWALVHVLDNQSELHIPQGQWNVREPIRTWAAKISSLDPRRVRQPCCSCQRCQGRWSRGRGRPRVSRVLPIWRPPFEWWSRSCCSSFLDNMWVWNWCLEYSHYLLCHIRLRVELIEPSRTCCSSPWYKHTSKAFWLWTSWSIPFEQW